MLALECSDSGWTPDDGPPAELAETVENILRKKSSILQEYFNFIITDDGHLLQLPLLLGTQSTENANVSKKFN